MRTDEREKRLKDAAMEDILDLGALQKNPPDREKSS